MIDPVVSAFAHSLLGVDSVFAQHQLDSRPIPGSSNNSRIKIGEIVFDDVRGVALWIDGYKDRANLGLRPQDPQNLGYFEEFYGADIPAIV